MTTLKEIKNLAESIYRQRLIIEAYPEKIISDEEIKKYLKQLGVVCDMNVLIDPITHFSEKFGWSGWVHWETSGAHFYAWEKPLLFFSVDIYTCKKFSVENAVKFTKDFFKVTEIVYKEV